MTNDDAVKAMLAKAVTDAQTSIPSEEITQTEMLEFIAASQRTPQYMQGRREAIKWAVTWLHDRANEMNDPHADPDRTSKG